MTSLQISLPEPIRAWIDEQVARGGYETVSAFVCALVSNAQKREAQDRLEALLLEGLDSGPPIEITPQYWDNLKQRARERLSGGEAK